MLNLSRICLTGIIVNMFYNLMLGTSIVLAATTIENQETLERANSELLSINKAFIMAVKNNLTVEVLSSRLEQARQKILQAKSLYWPVVNFKASCGSKEDYAFERNDVYQVGLGVSWIVFDGFRRKFENVTADCGEKIALVSFEDALRSLYLSISYTFHQAQLFQEKMNIAISDEKFSEHQLSKAEERYKVGVGSLEDILSFRIRLNKARMNYSLERKNYTVAMLSLASLLGNDDPNFVSTTNLGSLLFESSVELIPPDEGNMVDFAFKKRPDITMHKLFLKQSKALVEASKANIYPKIYFSASADIKKKGGIDFCRDDISSGVSVGLSYEFFPGGLQTAIIKEAQEREFELEKKMDKFLISAKNEIRSSFLKLRNAQSQVLSQRQNIDLIEQKRDLILKEYETNYASLTRLNEVQNEFTKSRSQLVMAIIALRQARIEYDILIGNSTDALITTTSSR